VFLALSGLQTILLFLSIINEILNFVLEFLQRAEDELELGKRMTIVKLMVYGYVLRRLFRRPNLWINPDEIIDLKHHKHETDFIRRTRALRVHALA
jgi:hypothetical protein